MLTPIDLAPNWCALALCILTNKAPEDAFLYLDGIISVNQSSKTRLSIEDTENMLRLRRQGHKYREIAEMYGITVSAVMKRVNRYLGGEKENE